MAEFVHLHVHTEYSLLDGAIRINDLLTRAKDLGMPAVAITDHGSMYGAVTFYTEAKALGIKPIIGCEVYVAPGDLDDEEAHLRKEQGGGYHLVLLAKNQRGYKNLIKLVSIGYLDGFYYKPRVSKHLLKEYSEGLIALSACLAGEVPRKLMNEGVDAGAEMARVYESIFPGNFYLELQDNGIGKQTRLNELLVKCADKTGLPLVATNDCHYLTAEDYEAHDTLLCIQTQTTVDAEKRFRMETRELYFKTPEEMERAFAHVPEAILNTQRIAEQCNLEIELGNYYFPHYELPEGVSMNEEFDRLCREGLKRRLATLTYEVDEDKYWKRLDYELGVIIQMGFPAYFLIVQDFINWAKDNRIPVGPGRGSAAGSIVAWSLKITNLDPLPYDLLFERFLNVERVSMPDIDVDFCERRRLEVVKYCAEKYGFDRVAQITTFGTMKTKAVIKDVGRALGMSFGETDRIAKLIPDDPGIMAKLLGVEKAKITVPNAVKGVTELDDMVATDHKVAKLIDISTRLEGLCRHASTHAAGVVISDKPMTEYLPLYKGKKGEIVTQFDMKKVEKVGLIKFDFLGLRTMTVIEDCLDIIREQGKKAPDLDTLALDDPATFAIFAKGDTDGIFQVESSGMRKYLRMLRPDCFEDIVAMLALYRPGPLGMIGTHGVSMVDEFIMRKHGDIEVTYPHPSLEDTLSPTYGVMVYQEQVMATAMTIANYSLGEGDLLRRAMGKKIAEEMAKQRSRFLEGARENKIDETVANEIFDTMEKFAAYGFNKSHSAAYALISYHTAYLKAHFPVEFMAALMSTEMNNTEKIIMYVNACRDMEIKVRQPDINAGQARFSVKDGEILFAMAAIKNVGEEAINEIAAERTESGPFKNIFDFCERVNLRRVTKRVLESLIKAGALDCFSCSRQALLEDLEKAVALGQKKAKEKESGMLNMLDMLGGGAKTEPAHTPTCSLCEEFDDREKLQLEKEVLGFFLSGHPLLAYRQDMHRLRTVTLEECKTIPNGTEVRVAVIIPDFKQFITRKGDPMAFCTAEDLTTSGEVTMLPNVYAEARELLDADRPLLVQGKIDQRDDQSGPEDAPKSAKILADKVLFLADAVQGSDQPVSLWIGERNAEDAHLNALKAVLQRYPGSTAVNLGLITRDSVVNLRLGNGWKVYPGRDFWKEIEAWQNGDAKLYRAANGE
ncbi:DNA polymerase III subunit alpha [Pseudodesulfovibrio indicus]|uniref:DNA polymerase III subunit alpha n=1 Tax=Pseudodesulfovibrio indicus TaxID=1716143 RepID=UPI00292DBA29|nr:DNA polymerase III subunit alpha [Pseudodesulfovibrio indicus]